MADEIPQIPQVEEIFVHTGNTVNWNRLKKRVTQSSDEEIADCISSTLAEWKTKQDENDLQYATKLDCINERFMEKLSVDERAELKVTAKIFCPSFAKDTLVQAVDRVQQDLGTTYIETVLLSLPEGKQSLDDMQPLWESLEDLVKQDKVLNLGVADINKDQLEELYNWAQVKPSIVQINLASCCVVPPELQEYAKQHDVQLLTHSDKQDILPVSKLQEIMTTNFTGRDAENWQPSWMCRYSVVVKRRGVIKAKGYVVRADRDCKLRK